MVAKNINFVLFVPNLIKLIIQDILSDVLIEIQNQYYLTYKNNSPKFKIPAKISNLQTMHINIIPLCISMET